MLRIFGYSALIIVVFYFCIVSYFSHALCYNHSEKKKIHGVFVTSYVLNTDVYNNDINLKEIKKQTHFALLEKNTMSYSDYPSVKQDTSNMNSLNMYSFSLVKYVKFSVFNARQMFLSHDLSCCYFFKSKAVSK